MQEPFGADKFPIYLLSVDPEYFPNDNKYLATAKRILEKQKIDWPNAFLPAGWNEVMRTFNVTGYGNIVVDEHGNVQGVHVHGKDLAKLVGKLMESKEKSKTQP